MKTKKLVLSSLFVSFGVVLPMAFHMFNMGGSVFLPMHIPVLIAGYFLGPLYAGAVGILTPILSSLLTGMPPLVPVMPIMALELLGYGLVCGFVFSKTNKTYLSLVSAMVVGRLFSLVGACIASLTFAPQISPIIYVFGGLSTAIPGMLIQLVFIPIFVNLLLRNKEIAKTIA